MNDGISLKNIRHPVPDDVNPDALEQVEIEIQQTFGMAKFYVEEGMYSISELEDLVVEFRKAKRIQDAALKQSMKKVR